MARIVVADDDADIRDLVAFLLRQSGHDVVPVADGLAAVEACRSERPALAVLDAMMPVMGGFDACRRLRGDEALAGVAVILLTGRAQESDVALGLAAGADDYVVKPFSPQELSSRVDAVLQRSRTSAPGTASRQPTRS